MNERIKELAEQATHYAKDICNHDADADWYEVRDAKFAELVRQDEREACAKLCESEGARIDASWGSCAKAIRGRTE
jgi:hypothetical protein